METLVVRIDADGEGHYRAKVVTLGNFRSQEFIGVSQENAFMGLRKVLKHLNFSGKLCLERNSGHL